MRRFIRTQSELEDFCITVSEDERVDILAIDVETEEFSNTKWLPSQLSLEGIGIYGGKKYAVYIVYDSKLDFTCLDVLVHCKPTVYHNAKFDVQVLEKNNIFTEIDDIEIHDTMMMSYLLDENRFGHGLKKLAKDILKKEDVVKFDDVGKKPKEELNLFSLDKENYEKNLQKEVDVWTEKMGDYCIDDCQNTYELYQKFYKQLKKEDGLWDVYFKIEVPFLKVLLRMETNGVKLDTDYLKKLEQEVKNRLIIAGSEIYKEAGKEIDINSPQQLRHLLFGEMKLELPDDYKTPKGDLSTDAKALNYLAKKGVKIAKLIIDYRELNKLQTTYITALPKLAIDNIIHCNWNNIGTKTGRISCNKPNLMNIPRRDDEFDIRAAFKPREGYRFVISDYSQVELRILAYFSKDERLLKTYQEGGDIHAETAKSVGCDRVTAKGVSFGIIYGRTAYGLSKGLGMTIEEGEKLVDMYFNKFPGVKDFIMKAINTVKKKKYIQTITRRKRRFPNYGKLPFKKGEVLVDLDSSRKGQLYYEKKKRDGGIERQATNAIIQGTAADIIKIAMRNIHRRFLKEGLDAKILLQIHDELVIEVKKGEEEKISDIVKFEMENAIKLEGVPIITEPETSDVWKK